MIHEGQPFGRDSIGSDPRPMSRPPSRARAFKEIVASLAKVSSIRGALLVTPDGLVITAAMPSRSPVEALAALGATLGREMELGSARLGRGRFKTALFVADHGTLFIGAGRIGFVILLGDENAQAASVQTALAGALDRL